MHDSCHLDRPLNVEIGVEYRIIFVVVFLSVVMKCILGHLQNLEKVAGFYYKPWAAIQPPFQPCRKQKSKQIIQHSTSISTFDDLSKWHDAPINLTGKFSK